MLVRELLVPGCFVVEVPRFDDARGFFLQVFSSDDLSQDLGIDFRVAQINLSHSIANVVRGVHFQPGRPGQGKYVMCISGCILDVAVEMRQGAPSLGVWEAIELCDDGNQAVLIPPGVGHAFRVLSESATIVYAVDQRYDPSLEKAVNPLDDELALPWKDDADLILSNRDLEAPGLADYIRGVPGPGTYRGHASATRPAR